MSWPIKVSTIPSIQPNPNYFRCYLRRNLLPPCQEPPYVHLLNVSPVNAEAEGGKLWPKRSLRVDYPMNNENYCVFHYINSYFGCLSTCRWSQVLIQILFLLMIYLLVSKNSTFEEILRIISYQTPKIHLKYFWPWLTLCSVTLTTRW